MLITHPSQHRPADARREAWLGWSPGAEPAARPALEPAARVVAEKIKVVRADAAAAYESLSTHVLLAGTAGGDAVSLAQDHVDVYPLPLFRYLAGTFAGQVRRIVPNGAGIVAAGDDRTFDRGVLGRALLHDIGVDAAGLTHLADAATVVKALHELQFFDGRDTQVIPYWRSSDVVRFGESFNEEDAFNLGAANPAGAVRVTVYRKLVKPGAPASHALIVILNEGAQAIRDQLYVVSPPAVFGGPNGLQNAEVIDRHDFRRLPNNSDWGKPGIRSVTGSKVAAVLRDVEDNGVVYQAAGKDGVETYGPTIFVGPHDFRLLYGRGR
jgi:hypothetical protein